MAKKPTDKKTVGDKVITPVFRVAFANVHKPRGMEHEDGTVGEPKYSIVMIFDKEEDLSAMKRLVKKAAVDRWGTNLPRNMRQPFRDGSEKDETPGFSDDVTFATASTFYKPGLVDKNRDVILDEEEFYSGCFARASVTAYTYDKKGNKGVAFGLHNLQKVRDGERLGGRGPAEDDFDSVGEDDEGEDMFD